MDVGRLARRWIGPVYLRQMPWHLPLGALALTAVGVGFIISARSPYAAMRQAQFAAVGCMLFAALALFDFRRLASLSLPLYAGGIVLLLALPFLGVTRNHARRWYDLYFFNFQPSEPMKFLVVLMLADYFQLRKGLASWRALAPPLAIVALPLLLIARQPDFGTSLMLIPSFFVIAFVAGVPVQRLVTLLVAGCVLAVAAWFAPGVIRDYQKERVYVLVAPERVRTSNAAAHSRQVLRAIRAGGAHGEGWGRGVLNRRKMLSERHTDFIFAVIAEEWGWWRTSGLILLYLLVIASLARVTLRTRDPLGRLLAAGILSMFGVQAMMNMSIAVHLAPITGLTLPLVSYGGSSLVSVWASFGVVASVGLRRTVIWTDEEDDLSPAH
jgi:rod shape determining protein RodA